MSKPHMSMIIGSRDKIFHPYLEERILCLWRVKYRIGDVPIGERQNYSSNSYKLFHVFLHVCF